MSDHFIENRLFRKIVTIKVSQVFITNLTTDLNIIIGGNVNLTETMAIFKTTSSIDGFGYLANLADYISLIGNVPVRNVCLFSAAVNLLLIFSVLFFRLPH